MSPSQFTVGTIAMAVMTLQLPAAVFAQAADLCDADWLARATPAAVSDLVQGGADADRPCNPSGDTPLSLMEDLVRDARSRMLAGEINSVVFSQQLEKLQVFRNPWDRSRSRAVRNARAAATGSATAPPPTGGRRWPAGGGRGLRSVRDALRDRNVPAVRESIDAGAANESALLAAAILAGNAGTGNMKRDPMAI